MLDWKYSFAPVASTGCTVLMLGSLPGDASLQQVQYYAHPRNAFWMIMGKLCGFDPDLPYESRLAQLNRAGIALWDVVHAGVRPGSLDSNIREVQPNDIAALLREYASIRTICCNGGAAYRYLKRFFPELVCGGRYSVHQLPSTSPAAARLSIEEKQRAYERAIAPCLCRSNEL